MENRKKINEELSIAGQPGADDFKQIAADGFKTVVNLRVAGEKNEVFRPEDERDAVEPHGMEYLHIPASMKQWREEQVDEFRNAVENLPKPILVHCAGAKRAGAFVMMREAIRQGWSGDETLQHAQQAGVSLDNPEVVDFVKSYVDSRRK